MDKQAIDDACATSYAVLDGTPEAERSSNGKPVTGFTAAIFFAISLLLLLSLVTIYQPADHGDRFPSSSTVHPRGKAEGVSAKSADPPAGESDDDFNWTNAMFDWQRTAYHFQPQRNWMNDPDGPLYHMGWYHLFYQYNPYSAVWGNITWGHAVSTDMIHWLDLPFSLEPDRWYDINGVWTGSATLLPDRRIVMLYTGDTVDNVQVQNLAYPANLSDPFLIEWVKYSGNPVLLAPPWINPKDFRDPSTAWREYGDTWLFTIGSKLGKTGTSLVYRTSDFTSFELLPGPLHSVPGTGMWECVDFYPVSTTSDNGLETSVIGSTVKHVLKSSLDNKKEDYYAVGSYDPVSVRWIPDNPNMDIGIGLRVDYGEYYASKSFYDPKKERRVLWGWIRETDSETSDVAKGWASVQTIPREVVFDRKTGANILQWPVEEIKSLRVNRTDMNSVVLAQGMVVSVPIASASALDITAEFDVVEDDGEAHDENLQYHGCNPNGSSVRGALGPFGLAVIATETLSELTPVYFYILNRGDGVLETFFCVDGTRSSMARDVTRKVNGTRVSVLPGEKYSMRILVDHSIIESFAQRGRLSITSRVYPTEAIFGATKLFIFNNATRAKVNATLTVWNMNSARMHPFQHQSS